MRALKHIEHGERIANDNKTVEIRYLRINLMAEFSIKSCGWL